MEVLGVNHRSHFFFLNKKLIFIGELLYNIVLVSTIHQH